VEVIDMSKIELELSNGKTIVAEYSELRILEVPEGMYRYSIRHSDEDWVWPVTVERNVCVNHMLDILVDSPLTELDELNYLEIKDWGFIDE
jgi:hypothetical protein